MHGSTKKLPIKLNTVEIKFDIGDVFMNGKNRRGKSPSGEFKATTPENLLLSKQTIISRRNPNT